MTDDPKSAEERAERTWDFLVGHWNSTARGSELREHIAFEIRVAEQAAREPLEQQIEKHVGVITEAVAKIASLEQRVAELHRLYGEYVKLLTEELDEIVPLAASHGWKSKRAAEGKRLREAIDAAKGEG